MNKKIWRENDRKRQTDMWYAGKMHGVVTVWLENDKKLRETYFHLSKEYARIEWDKEGNVIEVNLPAARLRPSNKDGVNFQIKR